MPRVSGTRAMPSCEIRCAGIPPMDAPLYVMVPRAGGVRPVMERSVVVLPAPFRPKRATTSPSPTPSESPCRMCPSP